MATSSQISQRLGDYIQFSLNDCHIGFLNINGKRCYIPKYDNNINISDLSEQYSFISKGDKLILSSQYFNFDSSLSLFQITSSPQYFSVFEKAANKMNSKNSSANEQLTFQQKKLIQQLCKIQQKEIIKMLEQDNSFVKYQCSIYVINRTLSIGQVKYLVTQTTKLLDIVNYINDLAGEQLIPAWIKAKNGIYDIYYTQGQFYKTFLELKLNEKKLTLIYPLIFDNISSCRIVLVDSSSSKYIYDFQIQKDISIICLVDKIKKIINDPIAPIFIRDSIGNNIQQIYWKMPIFSLKLKTCLFSFWYPPFVGYQCMIKVVNLPKGQVNFIYQIKESTSFNDLIKYIWQNTRCIGGSFQINDSQGNCYGHQCREQSLFSLKIKQKMFKFLYIQPTSLVSSKTKLLIQHPQKVSFQQMTIKQLFQCQNKQKLKIMSYNQQNKSPQTGTISCSRKIINYPQLFQITLSGGGSLLKIQCYEESTFFTDKCEWKPAMFLQNGQKLMILKTNLKTCLLGQIVSKKCIDISRDQQLFMIEVLPHHNFFANSLLMHNDPSLNVNAIIFSNNQTVKKQTIKCYYTDKLNKIFENKKLMLGGLILNNNLTFGDYQVYNFGTIFVYQANSNIKTDEYIISQWRQKTYSVNEVNDNLRNKWTTDCLGFQQSKIIQINKNLLTHKNGSNSFHLLIGPRTNLQKLYYTLSLVPMYSATEEAVYQQQFRPMIVNNSGYKQRLDAIIYDQKNILKNEKDALPIYLYTTNQIYRQLNQFLRLNDKTNQPIQIIKRWYSLTLSLNKSLEKLPSATDKVLYRGMSNICIKSAFNRRQNIDKQNYIILNGFTSTTTDQNVAKGFAGGKGAILTFKTQSGKDISGYSHFITQKQVLLPPFLYFLITKFNPDNNIQQMELQQIPFPRTDKKKLIFWVDDQPSNNTGIIKGSFQGNGIEVVQVTSTRLMKIILRDFFGILQALGKKIVIISDMARCQYGVWNSEAGVDLFNLIYKEFGMSNKAIIYTSDRNKAVEAVKKRGINAGYWEVTTDSSIVVKQVMDEFKKYFG